MTGLEEIHALIARGKRPAMMELLDIDLLEIGEGHVIFGATPGRGHYNPMGTVHGGYAATILDSACGMAASSATDRPMNCVTLELKIAYHAAMTEHTGPVRAIGKTVSIGRRIAYTEAQLLDAQDKLYASATSTLLLSEKPAKNAQGYPHGKPEDKGSEHGN